MKIKYWQLYVGLFLSATSLFSQSEDEASRLITRFKNLSEQQGLNVYLHTNKQKFIEGERLWFTGYVRGDNASSILWLGLYNKKGEMLAKNAYYLEDGIVYGDLPLDIPFGQYFIKASTGENTSNSQAFIQRITVNAGEPIQDTSDRTQLLKLKARTTNENFVAGVVNTVFYHLDALDANKDFLRVVRVLDRDGNIVQEIKPETTAAIGTIAFIPEENMRYSLQIELYGDRTINCTLSRVVSDAVLVHVNPNLAKDVLVHLSYNRDALRTSKKMHLISFASADDIKVAAIHWTGKDKIIKFPKQELPDGIIMLSVFDQDMTLIAHQMLYNNRNYKSQLQPLAVINKTQRNDSVFIQFALDDTSSRIRNASLSIMPTEYRNIDNDISILNHDLASRFANTESHKASLFFRFSTTRDLALLNSALSSVDASSFWKGKGAAQTKPINEGKGFSINGRVALSGIHKRRQLFLLQKSIGTFYTTSMSSSGDFILDNVILDKNSPINFIIKLGGKEVENPKIDFKITPSQPQDRLSLELIEQYTPLKTTAISNQERRNVLGITNEQLDEVIVVAKKKETFSRNDNLGPSFETKKIDEAALKKRKTLSSYIRSLGFKVRADPLFIGNIFIAGRDFLDNAPIVYVDGFRITASIRDEALESVEEIYYEHLGLEGSNGGTIYIYRRFDSLQESSNAVAQEYMPSSGFTFSSRYTNPILLPTFNNFLKRTAAVHWVPDLEIQSSDRATIGFPSFGLEGVRYSINGVTQEGQSFYQEGEILFSEK
jgi:hypothetical protein